MTATLTGDKEVMRRLEALTGAKQRAVLRQAARAAGSALIKATKPRIPDRKSRDERGKLIGLKRSMQQIPSSKWRGAADLRRQGIIGSRVGFKRSGSHAHLVEFGHEIVLPKGYKRRTHGFQVVRPRPFMRPAVEASKAQMKAAWRDKIIAGIRKATK